MPQHIRLYYQDRRALHALDHDFVISADGERAVISGEMEVTAVRLDDDRFFCLTVTFPSGEELDVRVARSQLLEQLDIEADEG